MDNDDKVTTEVAQTREVFLQETSLKDAGPPKLYSVDEEFERTRENRSPVVAIVVLSFVVVFAAVAVGVTYFIQQATKRVAVDINEFQDLNLTDILDGQKKNMEALQLAERDLADLIAERDAKLRTIASRADRDVEIAANLDVSAAERNRRIRSLRSKESEESALVGKQYAPLIAAKQREIDETQVRIDAYDSRMLEQARKSEELLNNQQRIFEIEKEQLAAYYEEKLEQIQASLEEERVSIVDQKEELVALLRQNHEDEIARLIRKYNPVFDSPDVLASLNRAIPEMEADLSQLGRYRSVLGDEGVATEGEMEALHGYVRDFAVVLERLREVPYINSVPGALERLEGLEVNLVAGYEMLWNRLARTVENKDRVIGVRDLEIARISAVLGQFIHALDSHTTASRENGYVLDPRDPERIAVYVNTTYPLTDGVRGYVFRREDEFIGTLQISIAETGVSASLIELADSAVPMVPFDKILIQLR